MNRRKRAGARGMKEGKYSRSQEFHAIDFQRTARAAACDFDYARQQQKLRSNDCIFLMVNGNRMNGMLVFFLALEKVFFSSILYILICREKHPILNQCSAYINAY